MKIMAHYFLFFFDVSDNRFQLQSNVPQEMAREIFKLTLISHMVECYGNASGEQEKLYEIVDFFQNKYDEIKNKKKYIFLEQDISLTKKYILPILILAFAYLFLGKFFVYCTNDSKQDSFLYYSKKAEVFHTFLFVVFLLIGGLILTDVVKNIFTKTELDELNEKVLNQLCIIVDAKKENLPLSERRYAF